ncbi:MAG: Gfo/Idh/MocA family oxidoreductase [Planctomycetota bacterium]
MKKARIGIIGLGSRSSMAIHWHQPRGNSIVVAGADISKDNLEKFKDSINKDALITTDYKQLLKRKDIDSIVITSPDSTHEKYAISALRAGKHVFCEKPLAITTDGCDRILREWKKSRKKLMVGFNMRYMRIFRVMKEVVDSGAIGQIKAVWVRHFVGRGGDWYYHDWHANRKNTTGLLLQKASHDLDMIHWITGKYIRKVSAFGSLDYYGGNKPNDLRCPNCPEKETCIEVQYGDMEQCVFRKEVNVEDNNVVIMELENGIKASYVQCHFTPEYFRNYTFIGTEGRIENLDDDNKIIVKMRPRSNKWKNLADRTYEIKPAIGGHSGADPVICKDFVDMILTGKEPLATPIAGRMSVAVGCAATKSLRSGGKVFEVPPLPAWLKKYESKRETAHSAEL